MSHVMCHDHFVGSRMIDGSHIHFRVCIENCRVCISSLDMIGHWKFNCITNRKQVQQNN